MKTRILSLHTALESLLISLPGDRETSTAADVTRTIVSGLREQCALPALIASLKENGVSEKYLPSLKTYLTTHPELVTAIQSHPDQAMQIVNDMFMMTGHPAQSKLQKSVLQDTARVDLLIKHKHAMR